MYQLSDSFRSLVSWQEARRLVNFVYRVTHYFPKCERYGLAAQSRRAAISIASNIAEGHGRSFPNDYRRFMMIARGSLSELESLLQIGADLNYIIPRTFESLLKSIRSIHKQLTSEIKSIPKI